MLGLSRIIESEFGAKFPIAPRELPNGFYYLIGLLLRLNWEFLQKNLGQEFYFNNEKSLKLEVKYRSVSETLSDQILKRN